MKLGLGLSLPNIAAQGVSLSRRIAAIFRKPNLEAHLYMPGPGVPVLGPELVVNGGFDTGISGWSAGNGSGIQWSSGALRVTRLVVGYTWPNSRQTLTGLLPGRAYAISSKVSNPSGLDAYQSISGKSSAEARSTLVSTTLNSQFVADSTTHSVDVGLYGATGAVGQYVDFESVSVREILGYTNKIDGFTTGNYLESTGQTHAVVDGAVGLVLDAAGTVGPELVVNGDFSNGTTGWTLTATAPSTASVTGGSAVLYRDSAGAAPTIENTSGLSAEIDKWYAVEFTITTDVVGSNLGISTGGVVQYPLSSIGSNGAKRFVFKANATGKVKLTLGGAGPITQTIDNISVREISGIHATQATTANKPTLRQTNGKYAWQFDGVDDRLVLGSVPFQMNDDHCVVAVVKLNAKTAGIQRIMHTGSGGDTPRVACIGFTSNGYADVNWRDDAGSYQSISGSVDLTGQVVVITARKIGNVKQLRVNGVQVGADNTVPLGVTTVTASNIGRHTADGAYFNGNIYVILPLKGAFSDADVKMIEKFAAQLAQVQL